MRKYISIYDEQEIPFEIDEKGDQLTIRTEKKQWVVDVHRAGPHHYSVIQDASSFDLRFFVDHSTITAFLNGEQMTFQLEDPTAFRKAKGGVSGDKIHGPAEVKALMPGKIIKVLVKKGEKVSKGQGLLVMEAMKMENEMVSPKEGTVTRLSAAEGQSTESGAILAVIE